MPEIRKVRLSEQTADRLYEMIVEEQRYSSGSKLPNENELSEELDTPVFVRLTTRIAHARSAVEMGEREEVELKPYQKNALKYVMMPAMARKRHPVVEAREIKLAKDANAMAINRVLLALRIGLTFFFRTAFRVRQRLPVYKANKTTPPRMLIITPQLHRLLPPSLHESFSA